MIWGLVIGTAAGAVSIPMSAIVATRCFHTRRGLVTGLLTASFATGNLIFPSAARLGHGHIRMAVGRGANLPAVGFAVIYGLHWSRPCRRRSR